MAFFDNTGQPQRSPPGDLVFLGGLTDKEWQAIYKFAEVRSFMAGDIIFSQGEKDDSFYILTAGSVEVLAPGGAVVATIPEGSLFGEIAFFDGEPRSATIRGKADGSTARMTRRNFDLLSAWQPQLARRMLLDLGKALALRFRNSENRHAR